MSAEPAPPLPPIPPEALLAAAQALARAASPPPITENNARADECLAAIRVVLQQYRCRLSTTQTITDGLAGPVTVIVIPLP